MHTPIKPITPKEVTKQKAKQIPSEVFEAFNELIAQNFDGSSATIQQNEAVKLIVKKGIKRSEIFDKGWLDIEQIYAKAGWVVEFDKPGYNEDYEAYFVFSIK